MSGDLERRILQLEQENAELRAQVAATGVAEAGSTEARLKLLLGDRLVLESLPSVVNVLDREQRIVYLNRTIPGKNVRDFTGTDARAAVAEEDRARYALAFEKAWQSGEPQSIEVRSLSNYWWESSLIPVKEGAEVMFMLITSTDITHRKRSEQALRESESRLRHALSASGMGTWTYQLAGEKIEWDPVVCALFGVTPERAPRNLEEYLALLHPDDQDRVRSTLFRYVETGNYEDLEHRVLLPDGRVRALLAKGTALLDEQGKTIGLRGGVFDVTAQKQLESQLQLAQKMQAVGQLTAGVAHNLNNALTVIIPTAEECRELATGALDERLADIEHAASRAAEMVRQLMLFARPQAGVAKVPFDLALTARRIADMCRTTFERRIEVEFAAEPVTKALGNAGQIEQVLLNVCLNARDALTPASGAEARISIRVWSEAPGMVSVSVRDNGTGMDDAVRARIFEPFFTTKDVGRGTGLGLASAYAIVNDHGGRIRCTSQVGVGTLFEIDLPLAPVVTDAVAEHATLQPPSLGSERILVVDDEAGVRRVLGAMLKRGGYEVLECADGMEAIRRFEGADPGVDAILLDRAMPGLSGEQVLVRLNALGVTIPVILLSGDPGGSTLTKGAALVLGKPVSSGALLATLRSLLDQRRSAHPR